MVTDTDFQDGSHQHPSKTWATIHQPTHIPGDLILQFWFHNYLANWELYRVIHKSVKHFKNSQQIKYSTDHGSSYADRKRNSRSFFLHISQMLNVSIFGNTADIFAIVHLVPHACQLITVDQEVFFFLMEKPAHIRSCPDLPLGGSSNKYGVQ